MILENFILDNINWSKLKTSFLNNKVPNAFIFHGNDGVGKEAHAIEYSALLNCKRPTNDGFACGECRSCYRVKSFNHEEIYFILPLPAQKKGRSSSHEISLDASTIEELNNNFKQKIDNPYHKIYLKNANTIPISSIRNIKKKLHYTKSDENWSVVIILDAEKLCIPKSESANSLLKILEEPPDRTLFILVTSKANLLIPTITSRCQKLCFKNLTITQLEKNICSSNNNSPIDSAEFELCNGSMSILYENINSNRLEKFKKIVDIFYSDSLINLDIFLTYLNKISKKEKAEIILYLDFLKVSSKDLWILSDSKNKLNLQFKFLFEFYNNKLNQFKNANWEMILNALDCCIWDVSKNVNLSLCIYSLLAISQSCLKGKNIQTYKTELTRKH